VSYDFIVKSTDHIYLQPDELVLAKDKDPGPKDWVEEINGDAGLTLKKPYRFIAQALHDLYSD
jgi:hypothetical protein